MQEEKASEDKQAISENCTFCPSKNPKSNRDQKRLIEDLYAWKKKVNDKIKKDKEFYDGEELKNLRQKPSIRKTSSKIASKVKDI